MSASASDAAESSRASQKPPPPPQAPWVVLASAPVLVSNDEELADIPGRRVLLPNPLQDPRRAYLLSFYLLIPHNTEHTPVRARAYIHATLSSGRILFRVVQGRPSSLYICDINNGISPRVPSVPADELGLGHDGILPYRSIGLIAQTQRPGHFMIAQLQHRDHQIAHPGKDVLLYYTSLSRRWDAKTLDSAPGRIAIPADDHGVLTHAGMLWWVALNHGLFFCDPFPVQPRLDVVPFPDALERLDVATPIQQRRSVRLSEGRLRFIDIRGLATDPTCDNPLHVCLFTLADPEPANSARRWTLDHRVPFSEICADRSYIDAGLPQPQNRMPHIAFVNPGNHRVVYFFLDSWIFGVDLGYKRVVDYHQSSIDHDRVRNLMLEPSRPILDAWELLLPPRPGDDPSSSDDDAGQTVCDFDEDSLPCEWRVNETVSTTQEGKGQSSSAGEPGSTI